MSDTFKLRGGPNRDYPCVHISMVECASSKCQALGRCEDMIELSAEDYGALQRAIESPPEPNEALRSLMQAPLSGYVMVPSKKASNQAASIICGHPFIQAISEEKQAEFEIFVRDVLQTTLS